MVCEHNTVCNWEVSRRVAEVHLKCSDITCSNCKQWLVLKGKGIWCGPGHNGEPENAALSLFIRHCREKTEQLSLVVMNSCHERFAVAHFLS